MQAPTPQWIWKFGYGLFEGRTCIWKVASTIHNHGSGWIMDQEFILRKNQEYTLKAYRDKKIFDSITFRFRYPKHILIKDFAKLLIENTYTEDL